MGQAKAAKKALWLKNLLLQIQRLGTSLYKGPSQALVATVSPPPLTYSLAANIIYCDNQGAVALATILRSREGCR